MSELLPINYQMSIAIRRVDRAKNRSGWISVAILKTLGVDGRTVAALVNRGVLEVLDARDLPIADHTVRLTRMGRRYV